MSFDGGCLRGVLRAVVSHSSVAFQTLKIKALAKKRRESAVVKILLWEKGRNARAKGARGPEWVAVDGTGGCGGVWLSVKMLPGEVGGYNNQG